MLIKIPLRYGYIVIISLSVKDYCKRIASRFCGGFYRNKRKPPAVIFKKASVIAKKILIFDFFALIIIYAHKHKASALHFV